MTIFELKILQQCLNTLSECTNVPLTYFDKESEIQDEYLKEKKFCCAFDCYYEKESNCRQMIKFSTDMAAELGSPYFFNCNSGLTLISMSVILHGLNEGCVLAGPFSMGSVDASVVEGLMEVNEITPETVLILVDKLKTIDNFSAVKAQKYSDLLYTAVSSCFKNWEEYNYVNDKYNEQIKAGNRIGKQRKFNSITISDEIEHDKLMDKLKKHIITKEKEAAMTTLERLLDKIFIDTSGNLDLIKLQVINVYSQMYELAQKNGIINKKFINYEGTFLKEILKVRSFTEVTELMRREVEYYVDELFINMYHEHSPMMEKAIRYIEEHFTERISLRDLAGYLHVNETYLSKLFKKEFSQCFTDYLNEIRINNSIILMGDHSKSLLEIANNVGYNNQSYYTKVFIKMKGVTPKHYRQELLKKGKVRSEGTA
ncbi:MAG: PocR ligand-binding domain-containing protein [Lachnospiraceae bacterium]|nr:PocR ligand-binding domain-containing protein [Lachnospiraceae bacterium]